MELPFFALRFDERRDFRLPPFFADAFLREERLFGAMVLSTSTIRMRDNCDLKGEDRTHQQIRTDTTYYTARLKPKKFYLLRFNRSLNVRATR